MEWSKIMNLNHEQIAFLRETLEKRKGGELYAKETQDPMYEAYQEGVIEEIDELLDILGPRSTVIVTQG